MDFGTISKLKVQELKTFLRLRGLNVSGHKEELIARVFVAYENNVPLIKSAEDVQQEIALEYRTKLIQILSKFKMTGQKKKMEFVCGLQHCILIFLTFFRSIQVSLRMRILVTTKPQKHTAIMQQGG